MKIKIHKDAAKILLYSLQWLGMSLALTMVIPFVAGLTFELSSQEIGSLVQRSLLFVGAVSLLQVTVGHKFVIIETPGGMWLSLILILAGIYSGLGKSLELLRGEIVAGMILSGLTYFILIFTGLIGKIRVLFTPLVNGTFLILMPLLLSGTLINGILGGSSINFRGFAAAASALVVIVFVSITAKGFLKTISILCGIGVGWLLAYLLGVSPPINPSTGIIALPPLFPWGKPVLNQGILFSCVITGILILANHVACTMSMAKVLNLELTSRQFNRSLAVTGFANILAGLGGLVAFVPAASSVGFVQLTGVSDRRPFIACTLFLIFLGLFPIVGGVVSAFPGQLGYAVLLVLVCQIFGLGLQEFSRAALDSKDIYICGLSILTGVGIMFIPAETFALFRQPVQIVLSNGLIMGLLICITLERILKRGSAENGEAKHIYTAAAGENENKAQ